MRLHLDSSISGPGDPRANAVGGVNSPATSRTADGGTSGDRVSLSGTTAILNQEASSRAERLQQISADVTSGSYRISNAAVATSIVNQAFR